MQSSNAGQNVVPLEVEGSAEESSPMLITSSDSVSFVRSNHYIAVSEHVPAISKHDKQNDCRFYLVLGLTLSYFFVEVFIGIRDHSLALVADAMHMLSDLIAMCIGLYAMRLSRKHANEYSTFGWTRSEVVGGLVNSTFMLAICLTITIDAIEKIIENEPPNDMNVDTVLWVAVGGLFLNLIGIFILGTGKHSTTNDSGEKSTTSALENKNMQGVLLHVAADGLGSVGVLASCLFIKFTSFSWKFLADPIFSILIVLLLAIATLPLMREAIAILLQQTPRNIDVKNVVARLLSWDGVLAIHHFHLWTLTSDKIIASMHVSLTEDADISTTINHFTAVLKSSGVSSVTIHPEKVGRSEVCKQAA